MDTEKLKLSDNTAHNDAILEMFKASFFAQHTMYRTCLIINGGAAISLLSFIGVLAVNQSELFVIIKVYLCVSEAFFFLGVFSAALTYTFAFLSQGHSSYGDSKLAQKFLVLSIFGVLLSMICFLIGGGIAMIGFLFSS